MAEPKTTHTYLLPSGAEIEIETLPEPKRGAGDVSKDQEKKKISFEEVLRPLGEVTQLLFEKIKSAVREPDSVTFLTPTMAFLNSGVKGLPEIAINIPKF